MTSNSESHLLIKRKKLESAWIGHNVVAPKVRR